ncbi:hypothetical protein F5Y14DRAFT_464962 [Nemania sp. NC0429]|nr:hypothetical protein F5Y14DRAFT_464962 [Nemania sp. NC0429]
MIWEEFVRTPRIIHVDVRDDTETDWGFSCVLQTGRYTMQKCEQVCPLLGVNRESRYIALKERLLTLDVQIPNHKHKRFEQASFARNFAIRKHDFLFFEGSGTLQFGGVWVAGGDKTTITNIMIDLDVHDINYQDPLATPTWNKVLGSGQSLRPMFANQSLRLYCVTRDSAIEKQRRFELDDLCDLTPEQFPEHQGNIKKWLDEFDNYPGPNGYLDPYLLSIKEIWKNVSVSNEAKVISQA